MPSYKIYYHPRSVKFLKKLSSKEKNKILTKIEVLEYFPQTLNLDIKKLINTQSSYRIRHRNIRIIVEVNERQQIIYVHEIDFRGNVY